MRNLIIAILCFFSLTGATYYFSTSGDDGNDCLSKANACATLDKASNTLDLSSGGNSVLFKCGDTWRGEILYEQSGVSGSPNYYGNYTDSGNCNGLQNMGSFPTFMGSKDVTASTNWADQGSNVWYLKDGITTGSEFFANPSFDTDGTGWNIYTEDSGSAGGAIDSSVYDSSPNSLRIDMIDNGAEEYDVQVQNLEEWTIQSLHYYELSFRAKATSAFTIQHVIFLSPTAPFQQYILSSTSPDLDVTTDWKTFTFKWRANLDADDVDMSITIGAALANGESFWVDTFSLKELDEDSIQTVDVGNIVFDDGPDYGGSVGKRQITCADVDSNDEYCYDPDNWRVQYYKDSSPYSGKSSIEMVYYGGTAAVHQDQSYVEVEGIHVKYACIHGFAGGNINDIYIHGVWSDFSGGCALVDDPDDRRIGGGQEFWDNGTNLTFNDSYVNDGYDQGITMQSDVADSEFHNVTFANNILVNNCWNIEMWHSGTNPVVDGLHIYNNLSIVTRAHWSEGQRPTVANEFAFYPVMMRIFNDTENISIDFKNNIIDGAQDDTALMFWQASANLADTVSDNNIWFNAPTNIATVEGTDYTTLSGFQSATSQDANSSTSDPLYKNFDAEDYHLTSSSPAINAGALNPYATTDADGKPRAIGNLPDIGPYEWGSVWRGTVGGGTIK